MLDPFNPLRNSMLVSHKSNENVKFIVCDKTDASGYYLCRRINSNPKPNKVSEFIFHYSELNIVETKIKVSSWNEYDIVFHRSNPEVKMVALEYPNNGKCRCKWVIDSEGSIIVSEFEFYSFELSPMAESF